VAQALPSATVGRPLGDTTRAEGYCRDRNKS
jgi:hypothetical protein